MSTMLPSVRGKSWVVQVTILCVVLGALLGLSLRTQRELASEDMPSRIPALRAAYSVARAENETLRKELSQSKKNVDKLSEDIAQGYRGVKDLVKSRDEARLLAGAIAVRGPGVIVTITDSPKLESSETDPLVIEEFMVHAEDIRSVVDELLAAGAEAISINGQRRTATTSIRCVGPLILVNSVKLAPPYQIKAVGKAEDLEKAIMIQGGPATFLISMNMISVKKKSEITVPAYTGSTTFQVAKPVVNGKRP